MKKSLYRIKQAPRVWYDCINAYFQKSNFEKYPYEHTLYTKCEDRGEILMCAYVKIEGKCWCMLICRWVDFIRKMIKSGFKSS